MAMSKQSDGVCAASTGTGASPLRPYITCSRSACSVLVGMPGAGAGALDVADHQRQLGHHGQTDGLGLQRDARTGGGGDAQMAGEAGAEGRADAGDLVLGLERGDPEPLVLAQLVQHVGGRGDRVGTQEHRQVGLARAGDEPVRQRDVAGDLPVGAGRHRGRRHLVRHREDLGGLAEGEAGLEGGDVGVADGRLVGELGGEEVERALGRAAVEPGQQPEREHVLRPGGVLAGQPELLDRLDGHPGQVERSAAGSRPASRPRGGWPRSRPWPGCAW